MELQSCKFKELQFTLKNLQTQGIKALHTSKKKVVKDIDKSTATNLTLKVNKRKESKSLCLYTPFGATITIERSKARN